MNKAATFALLLFLPFTFVPSHSQDVPAKPLLNVYDGFEAPVIGPLWETSRLVPGAAMLDAVHVRAGKQALAVTVRAGNVFEAGRHGNADSERSELMEARALAGRQGQSLEFRFSMFFPLNFPIVDTRLVIAQWKQYCPEGIEICSDDSPVLALRYIRGVLSVTQDLDHKFITLFSRKAEFRSRWLDFRVQTRFVPNAKGRVKVWLNEEALVDYRGNTANTETSATGYPPAGHFYFKMGLYRNVTAEPMTVYIDEYRKRELPEQQLDQHSENGAGR